MSALLTRYLIEGNARRSRGIGVRGMRLSSSRNRTDRATIFAAPAMVEAKISNDRFDAHPSVSIDSSAAPMRPAKGQIARFSLQVFVGDQRRLVVRYRHASVGFGCSRYLRKERATRKTLWHRQLPQAATQNSMRKAPSEDAAVARSQARPSGHHESRAGVRLDVFKSLRADRGYVPATIAPRRDMRMGRS